ncbi:hypothetical protein SAMN05216379_12418 [Nitrosomonas eutropha]|nr:hypothetical protein SAMN05216379_12418 [Nitrosomonas eutropha]
MSSLPIQMREIAPLLLEAVELVMGRFNQFYF